MDDVSESQQRKVIQMDGVRITITPNSIEFSMRDTNELWEQYAVQHLKEWCRWRKRKTDKDEEWKRPK